jgi:hypothetical protein
MIIPSTDLIKMAAIIIFMGKTFEKRDKCINCFKTTQLVALSIRCKIC